LFKDSIELHRRGICLFQPNLTAADGVAVLAAPGGARFAAPDWRRILMGWQSAPGFGGHGGPYGLIKRAVGTDLTVDLGDSIGTRPWWLGLAACTSLCAATIALGTMVPAIPSLQRTTLTPAQHEAMLPQAIAPLALGGTTGSLARSSPRLVEPLAEAPERPRLELSATITGRDGFDRVLRRAGVAAADTATVTRLLRGTANVGALPRGTDIDIVLGRRDNKAMPRPLEAIGFRAAFDLKVAISRADGGLRLKRIPIAVDHTPLRLQGLAGSNVQKSLRSAGLPGSLVTEFTRTMGYAIDFQRGIGRKDRFDIIVERDAAETGDVRYGRLLYAGLNRVGKEDIELGRYDFGGQSQFFRPSGESAKKGLMRTPVDGARLTSGFGMRFHPLLAYSRIHQGVDFGAAMGSPIYAAAGGKVTFAARHGGHGNYVMIRHNNDLTTGYAHMSRFAVRPGQAVGQGQIIGYVGSTGISTGPHLHYEVWLRGKPTNPVALKFSGGTKLGDRDLYRFLAEMSHWRSLAATGKAAAASGTMVAAAITGASENRASKRRRRGG
jgi:murein DD-endopeptidase MepM/ murein hydrolase activator NlpD